MYISDIKQGKNGDCFILSSIISILHTLGPAKINQIINLHDNYYFFNFYKSNHLPQRKKLSFSNILNISKKNEQWVQLIESAYINVFYNNNLKLLLQNGGIAQQVLFHLTGMNTKIIINRLFDEKEELYYEICNETICKEIWSSDFMTYLDKIFTYQPSKFKKKIWNIITNNRIIQKNIYYSLDLPCLLGINGHYENIEIPGIVTSHIYAILGFEIDNDENQFIYIYNSHHNTPGRITKFDNVSKCFHSTVHKSRQSILSLQEVAIYGSDFTYCLKK